MSDHEWARDMSTGDLRRLLQHTREVSHRLDKMRRILDESGAVDRWNDEGKPQNPVYNLTAAYASLDESHGDVRAAYNARSSEVEQ